MSGMQTSTTPACLRAGMVGLGMIFDETYRPLFEQLHAEGLYRRDFGPVAIELAAVASRTGKRAEEYRSRAAGRVASFVSCVEPDAGGQLLLTESVACPQLDDLASDRLVGLGFGWLSGRSGVRRLT